MKRYTRDDEGMVRTQNPYEDLRHSELDDRLMLVGFQLVDRSQFHPAEWSRICSLGASAEIRLMYRSAIRLEQMYGLSARMNNVLYKAAP